MTSGQANDEKGKRNMVAFGVRFDKDFLDGARDKASPVALSRIIRALVEAWFNGDIVVEWDNDAGEFRVKR